MPDGINFKPSLKDMKFSGSERDERSVCGAVSEDVGKGAMAILSGVEPMHPMVTMNNVTAPIKIIFLFLFINSKYLFSSIIYSRIRIVSLISSRLLHEVIS